MLRFVGLLAVCVVLAAADASARDCRCSLTVSDRGVDLDRDGVFDALEVKGDALLDSAGTYSITPMLGIVESGQWTPLVWSAFSRRAFSYWHEGRWPVGTPLHDTLVADGMRLKTDSRNHVRFEFLFDGEEVADIQQDAPWSIQVSFLRVDNLDPRSGHPLAGQAWTRCEAMAPNLGMYQSEWIYPEGEPGG